MDSEKLKSKKKLFKFRAPPPPYEFLDTRLNLIAHVTVTSIIQNSIHVATRMYYARYARTDTESHNRCHSLCNHGLSSLHG